MTDPHPGLTPTHYGYASVAELEERLIDDAHPDTLGLLQTIDQDPDLLAVCTDLVYEVLGLWEDLDNYMTMPFSAWCRDLLDALGRRVPDLSISPSVEPWRFGYWMLVRLVVDGFA